MTGFAKLFWGLLLVFLDFRVNGFDVLPDIIGFILVYSGLSMLAEEHARFLQAKKITVPLLVLSILDLIPGQLQISVTEPASLLGFLLAAVATVLNLLLLYYICQGIGELARAEEQHELVNKAGVRWQYFLWVSIAGLALLPIAMGAAGVAALFAIPIAILGLISYILLLALIREADQRLRLSLEG